MDIYLSTVAMEKNRWSSKVPSYAISDYALRALSDGFAGLELWENHLLAADEAEQRRLYACGVPILYNTYLHFSEGVTDSMRRVADSIARLGAKAVKFNLDRSVGALASQLDTLMAFAGMLEPDVRLLCECHPGTPMEAPTEAARIFAQLPTSRFGAIVHLAPVKGENARRFELYGPRITHLHSQLRMPGSDLRTRLDEQPGIARDLLRALLAWGFTGTASIEFTRDGDTVEETYQNCVADLLFIKEAIS